MTFYSENTFLLFTLLGFLVIYYNQPMQQEGRAFQIPKTWAAFAGCFFFGAATLTRATGVLLSIFIAFFVGNSFLVRCDRLKPAAKAVITALLCIAIMVAPLIIIVYVQPYMLHCDLRFKREWQGPVPEWCYDKIPNVFTFI